jgi:hypothetical protein
MARNLRRNKLVCITEVLQSVSKVSSVTLEEATDAMCDLTSSDPDSRGGGDPVVLHWFDAEGSSLAVPVESRLADELAVEFFNCRWWERGDEAKVAGGSVDRWRIPREDAEKLASALCDYLAADANDEPLEVFLAQALGSPALSTQPDDGRDQRLQEQLYEQTKQFEETVWQIIYSVQDLACKRPELFTRMICEAALGKASADGNFFAGMLEKGTESDPRKMSSRARSAWRGKELAEFMLEVLELVESEQNRQSDTRTGFVSIRDLAVRYEANGGIDRLNFGRLGASTRLSYGRGAQLQEPDFFWDYFEAIVSNVDLTLFRVCELVYNGIPLFRKLEDGTYQQIDYSEADYIYLSKMGEHGGIPESWRLPYWANEYFLDEGHIRAHRIFFSQAEPPTPAQVVPLKAAFRAHIGCAQVPAAARQGNP